MRLKTIYELIDGVAPFELSKEYCEKFDAYDNSGILIDCGEEIKKILFSLDCSRAALDCAKEIGANLLITHHPAIYSPLRALRAGEPVFECARAGVSVISAHLNLDCAEGGIDESLMSALGGKEALSLMHALSCGGYGRVYEVTPLSLSEFVSRAKERLSAARCIPFGEKPVSKVASFCGAGFDEEAVAFAAAHGADTIVSSDEKHHVVAAALEKGMNAVVFTHYAAENYGFERFYQKIKKSAGVPCEFFADARFM